MDPETDETASKPDADGGAEEGALAPDASVGEPKDKTSGPEEEKLRLEVEQLGLENEKLRKELRSFEWPGWWEVGKLAIALVGVVSVGLGVLQYRSQRIDRAVDLLYSRPEYGALLLAQQGPEGEEALFAALASEVDAAPGKGRPVSLAILRQMRGYEGARVQKLASRLKKQFSELEMPRTLNMLEENRLQADAPAELPIALCVQAEINQNLSAILRDHGVASQTIQDWEAMKKANSAVSEETCR